MDARIGRSPNVGSVIRSFFLARKPLSWMCTKGKLQMMNRDGKSHCELLLFHFLPTVFGRWGRWREKSEKVLQEWIKTCFLQEGFLGVQSLGRRPTKPGTWVSSWGSDDDSWRWHWPEDEEDESKGETNHSGHFLLPPTKAAKRVCQHLGSRRKGWVVVIWVNANYIFQHIGQKMPILVFLNSPWWYWHLVK